MKIVSLQFSLQILCSQPRHKSWQQKQHNSSVRWSYQWSRITGVKSANFGQKGHQKQPAELECAFAINFYCCLDWQLPTEQQGCASRRANTDTPQQLRLQCFAAVTTRGLSASSRRQFFKLRSDNSPAALSALRALMLLLLVCSRMSLTPGKQLNFNTSAEIRRSPTR